MNGKDVELSFFDSMNTEVEDEHFEDEGSKPVPGEYHFEDSTETLLWLRACCISLLKDLQKYAAEKDDYLEGFDYYDGFLSRIEVLLSEYLDDIEDFERISENLYDGDWS